MYIRPVDRITTYNDLSPIDSCLSIEANKRPPTPEEIERFRQASGWTEWQLSEEIHANTQSAASVTKTCGQAERSVAPRSGACHLDTVSFDKLGEVNPAALKVLENTFKDKAQAEYEKWDVYERAVFLNTVGALGDAFKSVNLSIDQVFANAKFRHFYKGDGSEKPFGVVIEGITAKQLDEAKLGESRILGIIKIGRRSPERIKEASLEATREGDNLFAFDVDLWNPKSEFSKHKEEVNWNHKHHTTTHPADVARALQRRGVETGVICKQ